MLAALLRFEGVLVAAVLVVEYLAQRSWNFRKIRADLLWVGSLGMALYLGFIWWRFGDPHALTDTQYKGWGHEASFFIGTYWDGAVVPLWNSLTGVLALKMTDSAAREWQSPVCDSDLAMPLVLLAGAIVARKKLLASEWTWLLLGIVFPLSSGVTNSLARYMLPLWPGLIWIALVKGPARWLVGALLLVSLGLLAWCSAIYGGGMWIG